MLCARSGSKASRKLDSTNLSSLRQRAVADAVKFGVADTDEAIPFIDGATTHQEQNVRFIVRCRSCHCVNFFKLARFHSKVNISIDSCFAVK